MKVGDIVKTQNGDKREILKIIVSDDKTIVVSVSVLKPGLALEI